MTFLKLLFCSSSLMLIIALISSSDASRSSECTNDSHSQNKHEIVKNYDAIDYYDIRLDFMNLDKDVIFGTTKFQIKIWCDTHYIILNSINLNIMSVRISNVADEYDIPIIQEVAGQKDIILLDLWNRKSCTKCPPEKKLLQYGYYQVLITYNVTLTINPAIFVTTYTNEENENTWLVATDFSLNHASRLFPYWDEMATHSFKFKIIHPKGYKIFSNVETNIADPYGMEHIFDMGSTYPSDVAIAMVSTKFKKFYSIGTNINMYCRDVLLNDIESFKFANDSINDIIMFYMRKNWTKSILDTKMDYIIIPNYWHNSMRYHGLSFIRESDLIYRAESDLIVHRYNVLRLIGRAIGYPIVDGLIKSYGVLSWLKEGLAILLGAYIVDQVDSTPHLIDLLVVQTQHQSLRWDTDLIMNSLALNNPFDYTLSFHMKAPFILRMIQQIPSGNALYTGRKYKRDYETLRNYWYRVHPAVSKNCQVTLPFSVTDVIYTWMMQRHYPVLNVTRDDTVVMITAGYSESEQNVYENKWYIPFTYVTESNLDFPLNLCNTINWLTPEEGKYNISDIPTSDWIIINLQQTGYYRVYYDQSNWLRIIDYMNSEYFDGMHVLNRAQLIDDSFNFMITQKEFSSNLFWKLTKYLEQETNYIAWYPMFKAFEYLSSILAYDSDDTVSDFKHIMAQFFDSFEAKYLSSKNKSIYGETNDESILFTSLKLEAIKWACIFGSPICLSNATHYLKIYVANSSSLGIKEKYSAEWVTWAFYNGLIEADQETWNNFNESKISYNDIYEKRRLETALARSKTSNIVLNDLQGAINKSNIEIILPIIVKHANKDAVLTKILFHLQSIQLSEINRIALLCIIINSVYADGLYSKILRYVQDVLSEVTIGMYVKEDDEFVIGRVYAQEVIENIVQKVNVRQSQSTRIYDKYITYVNLPFLVTND